MLMTEQFLWVEKFRPQKVKDCILPGGLKQTLQAIVDSGEMQNLLFSGGPGCGKTTAAIAMCEEMGAGGSRSTAPRMARHASHSYS